MKVLTSFGVAAMLVLTSFHAAEARQECYETYSKGKLVKTVCRENNTKPSICPDCRVEVDPKEVRSVRKNVDGSVTVQRADQTEERWNKFGDTWYRD